MCGIEAAPRKGAIKLEEFTMRNTTLKKSLCVLLAVLMLFGLLNSTALGNQRHPFTDVQPDAWYNDAVQFVWENGIMVGTSETQFSPNATLTRAMVATILYRMAGEPQTTFRPIFSDVTAGLWYSVPVTWANDTGIVQGIGGGRFAPNDQLTREQLSAMMHRYAVSQGYDVSVPADVTAPVGTSNWAREYVRWAVHNSFISANTPNAAASRAETAHFVYRFENPDAPPADGRIDIRDLLGMTFTELIAQYGHLFGDYEWSEVAERLYFRDVDLSVWGKDGLYDHEIYRVDVNFMEVQSELFHIAGIAYDSTRSDILAIFGQPDEIRQIMGGFYTIYSYDLGNGVNEFGFIATTGQVIWITAIGQS